MKKSGVRPLVSGRALATGPGPEFRKRGSQFKINYGTLTLPFRSPLIATNKFRRDGGRNFRLVRNGGEETKLETSGK